MEFKQIKELMAIMGRTGMKRLVIKREAFELELERETEYPQREIVTGDQETALEMGEKATKIFSRGSDLSATFNQKEQIEQPRKEEDAKFVLSPMVGTFYDSPSPGEASFVKVGDRVSPDTIICIIEAMKVMNEVKAGISGTVQEVLVDNGLPVEFGTKLFKIS